MNRSCREITACILTVYSIFVKITCQSFKSFVKLNNTFLDRIKSKLKKDPKVCLPDKSLLSCPYGVRVFRIYTLYRQYAVFCTLSIPRIFVYYSPERFLWMLFFLWGMSFENEILLRKSGSNASGYMHAHKLQFYGSWMINFIQQAVLLLSCLM